MTWLTDVLSYRIQLASLVRFTTIYVALSAPFLLGSVWSARKRKDFSGIFAGNVGAIAVSFLCEGFFLRAPELEDVSLGRALAGFFLFDFLFYWNHRINHKIPFTWYLFHYCHHRSESYGLYIASIAPSFYKIINFSLKIYLIHLLTGLPLPWAFQIAMVHFDLQFFSHTLALTKVDFGPLEYILSTPAAHAVHHASNKELLDKNFGGLTMIWDHLFGTFVHGPTAAASMDIKFGTVVNPVPEERWWSYLFGGETAIWRKFLQRSHTG